MPDRILSPGPKERWDWVIVLGVALVVTELVSRVLGAPAPVPAVMLLLALFAPVYAGIRAGSLAAIASAAALAAYTPRFVGAPGRAIDLGPEGITGAIAMLVIGLGLGLASAWLKRREDALKIAIARKARDLEIRNAELAEANSMLEAFTYVVSHDLKEPVRAIDNYLLATEEEYGTPEGRTFLARAHQANQRLITLLQGLLDVGRVSLAGNEMRDVRLGAVLDSDACRTMFEALAEERGAVVAVAPDLPVVLGDEAVLAQLFGNLVLNAIKHNPGARPHVHVRVVGASDGRVGVAVDDDGPGFPPEIRARFAGARTIGPAHARGGFGLILADRAARRLGGRLHLEASPEGGGRARVELPTPASASAPVTTSILPRGRQ